jgi:hypothetical protein
MVQNSHDTCTQQDNNRNESSREANKMSQDYGDVIQRQTREASLLSTGNRQDHNLPITSLTGATEGCGPPRFASCVLTSKLQYRDENTNSLEVMVDSWLKEKDIHMPHMRRFSFEGTNNKGIRFIFNRTIQFCGFRLLEFLICEY